MRIRLFPLLVTAGLFFVAGYAAASLPRREARPRRDARPKEIAYRGNERNLVFHGRGCRYFKSSATAKGFSDRAEAVRSGYQPCKLCKP
jgi:methylphosphotriester-DNA--protein-cysteine methyltransferase